jgi:NAD-dependent deacetylase
MTANPMFPTNVPSELVSRLQGARAVAVITGAGMSAESGVPTFRDASAGLWANLNPQDIASPEGWVNDKSRVWAWYEWRRGLVSKAQPNAGHYAIAQLSASLQRSSGQATPVTVITQNVDDLHERGGLAGALHVHGSLFAPRCAACGRAAAFTQPPPADPVERITPPSCDRCGGFIRPGVVWFGENLDVRLMGQAVTTVRQSEVLLVVGTSGVVRPVSELPAMARDSGAWICEINPIESGISAVAHLCWRASAAQALPALLQSLSEPQG